MASDYGLNFGFRVSGETLRIANGTNIRTPVGSSFQQGTLVEINNSSAGYLKQAGNAAKPRAGVCGLLLQEEVWDRSIYQSNQIDSFSLGVCLPNRLSVITSGAGVKIWMKNTGSITRADGRVIGAVAMFTNTSVALGRGLQWNGSVYVDIADPLDAASIGEVVAYTGTNYVEVILNK